MDHTKKFKDMANTKSKFTEFSTLLYSVLSLGILTNCVGVYSFMVGDAEFSSLPTLAKIATACLILIVWAIEPAIKKAWENIWRKKDWVNILIIVPLTSVSIVFTSWGLSYLGTLGNSQIERVIVDFSEVDSLTSQIETHRALNDSLSAGKMSAFMSPRGIMYASGLRKMESLDKATESLEARRDIVEKRLNALQLLADQEYEEKVQDFELLSRNFSFVFQIIAIVLIFLLNYTPTKKSTKPVNCMRNAKMTEKLFKAKLQDLPEEFKKKYKRTLLNEEKYEMVYYIALNEGKHSIREIAAELNEKPANIQNYRDRLREVGLI